MEGWMEGRMERRKREGKEERERVGRGVFWVPVNQPFGFNPASQEAGECTPPDAPQQRKKDQDCEQRDQGPLERKKERKRQRYLSPFLLIFEKKRVKREFAPLLLPLLLLLILSFLSCCHERHRRGRRWRRASLGRVGRHWPRRASRI